MREGPTIALAVVTRDRAPILRRCALPGLEQTAAAGFEVVVVDQSAGRETAELIEGSAGLRYLRSEPGLSRGRNVALAATTTPLLAFTDDDVSLPEGWLERIAGLFESNADAGVVCGRALTPKGALMPGAHAGTYRWPLNPFGLGSGFNMAFRREALDAVGAFDDELGAGARYVSAEDSDLLYRVARAGWTVVCSDTITVVHDDWRSGTEDVRLHYGYGYGAGAQTAKHVAAGDRTARSIALHEAGRHVATLVRAVLTFRLQLARLQAAFLAGLARGFAHRRSELRRREDRGTQPRPPEAASDASEPDEGARL